MSSLDESTPLFPEQSQEIGYVPTGWGASLPCDPRRRLHRFLVLILICLLSFGSYFCYDNPAALQIVMEKDLNISSAQYMNFYSFYSWPNVILCLIGGFLIDKVFGIRWGAIIFAGFVTVGQVLFAVGGLSKSLYLMYAARFVFGIGGESLAVAQNTYASSWFTDTELNFIFGLQLSVSRIGSTVNMIVMQKIYNTISIVHPTGTTALGTALLIATSLCILSLICAAFLAMLDYRAKRILGQSDISAGETIKITDVKDFPAAIYLICIICVTYYVAIFPFISGGQLFFSRKYLLSPDEANYVNSLCYIVSAAGSPVSGFFIDLTGKNLFWVMGGIIATIGCHLLFAFTTITPYFIIVLLGLSYSVLASALWPLVVFVMPIHQRGTAYGLIQAVQNLGLGVIAIVAGVISDNYGYLILEVFFLIWLSIALMSTFILYLWNVASNGKLNYSARYRRSLQENCLEVDVSNSVSVSINT